MEQHHGVHLVLEVSGEGQSIAGQAPKPPGKGPRFGRIFPHSLQTPPFTPDDSRLDTLGKAMTAAAQAAISTIPAGYTYFGQFIDHDITKDGTADLPQDVQAELPLEQIKQLRSPSLDLDSVYDCQANDPPVLEDNGFHLRLGTTQATPAGPTPPFSPASALPYPGHDVPRDPLTGRALIGDPRNDENLIVQQIHNLFLRFHNKVADHVVSSLPVGTASASIMAQTRRLVTRHYQWLVLNDFLHRFVLPDVFSDILGATDLRAVTSFVPNPLVFKISGAQTPPMPLEFSAAAYRMGHSMIRQEYSWNNIFNPIGFQPFFDFTHLSGNIQGPDSRLITFPSNWIADWRRMFALEDVTGFPAFVRGNAAGQIPLNVAMKIDTSLAPILGTLPGGTNLASRNLIRGSRMGLPSGQDVAAEIRSAGDALTTTLTPTEILDGLADPKRTAVVSNEFHIKTPLWFYILREAELTQGDFLGRVGSRIVLETFLALIRCSKTSIFSPNAATPGALEVFNPADSPLRTDDGEPLITMAHLIAFTGGVNPLGD